MWNFFDPFEPGGEKRDSVHRTHTHTHARAMRNFRFAPFGVRRTLQSEAR